MYSDFYYLTIQVKKHISNIVTSFWTYDYHYCDKVKKKPDEYSHFLEARSKEYENNKDYRLINILRHYIQHIDFPEININNLVDQESVVLDIRIVKRNLYKLNLDTHEIDTLNSFQDTINVVDVVNSFQDSMKRIHYVLSNIVKDAFIKEIPILTGYLRNNILSNIGKYDKIGIVTFDQESDKKALQLQISWIPNEIIELVKDD